MKTLKLTSPFKSKLDRLESKVTELNYLGCDFTEYDDMPIVAIVGTRKPTPYGKMMVEKLSEELAKAGVVIVSGLALGVDSLAHDSCVKAGGRTIAVLPSGINNIYPATNRNIAKNILKNNGTLISEYATNHQPRKVEFLERNRIIAALSDLVIIPEAAANSGSLNTANHAKKMGIPIYVVPGNVTSPMSKGTNHLLKNGANAITEASDVFKILGISKNSDNQLALDLIGDTPEETLILQKISQGITNTDDLREETKLSTTELQSAITMLEIQAKVTQDSLGNWHFR
jgi:DNA processing protein